MDGRNSDLDVKYESKKIGLAQKFTIGKKSTIFALSSWNLVKLTTSWGSYFDQVWWG